MYTVFMPRDFDDDVWRCRPGDWEPELRRRRKVGILNLTDPGEIGTRSSCPLGGLGVSICHLGRAA